MNAAEQIDEIEEFDRYLTHSFDRDQEELRQRVRLAERSDAIQACRDDAWRLYRDVFAGWEHVERNLAERLDPAGIVAARNAFRALPRFDLFRYANFPDASRLLDKAFPDVDRLERQDERNPGAPPAMRAVYAREPGARGPFPIDERSFIEVLDYAAMRLIDIEVVHQRTHAAVRALLPRIRRSVAHGRDFALLDVACGGSQLARHLLAALEADGALAASDRRRVHILGVDVDSRSIPYTYASSGLGWHTPGDGASVDVTIGNLFDPGTMREIGRWLSRHEIAAFDCVTALGILDYFGCGVPGEARTYLPEGEASAFGKALLRFTRQGGMLVGAVFASEGYDDVSTGARHLFAHWQIEHATLARTIDRFPFLATQRFRARDGQGRPPSIPPCTFSLTMSTEDDRFVAIRRSIVEYARSSDAAGVGVAALATVLYLGSLAAFDAVASPWRWVWLGIASFLTGTLFIVGHDACHLALTRSGRLNRAIGRIVFVPTLHPYTAWEIGHNRRHHGFTNLRTMDYVWRPWSVREYQEANGVSRLLYRFYHTAFGIGLYYPIEIWYKRMWRDDDSVKSARDAAAVIMDRAFAVGGFALLGTGSFAAGIAAGHTIVAAARDTGVSLVAPLLVFHYLMSVVIFIHHRHPKVVWFDDPDRYTPYEGQVEGTVHATLPRIAELAFLDIFAHTAHHANARIPLYALAAAQRELRKRFPDAVRSAALGVPYLLGVLRECQLYDYEARRWLRIEAR